MCGIFFYLVCHKPGELPDEKKIFEASSILRKRGGTHEKTEVLKISNKITIFIAFYRLAINDLSEKGNQPFVYENKLDESTFPVREKLTPLESTFPVKEKLTPLESTAYVIANAEMYDHRQLYKDHILGNTEMKYHVDTDSDCQIIYPLFKKHGINRASQLFRSEFAFIILEVTKDDNIKIFVSRDTLGVRPIYMTKSNISYLSEGYFIGFASIMSPLIPLSDAPISQFPPANTLSIEINKKSGSIMKYSIERYYDLHSVSIVIPTKIRDLLSLIRYRTFDVCKRMLLADAPVVFSTSGGFDSSLVTCVSAHILKEHNPDTKITMVTCGQNDTGYPISPDILAARIVADFLRKIVKVDHHEIPFDIEKGLKSIPTVIQNIETRDCTTCRASVGEQLVSSYISTVLMARVVPKGDGSDEISGGYKENWAKVKSDELRWLQKKRLSEIHMYDGLRADRCLGSHNLEGRFPLMHLDLVEIFLSVPPELLVPQIPFEGDFPIPKEYKNIPIEKALFRSAFNGYNIMPDEILFRSKSTFSDAITPVEKTWNIHIKEYMIGTKDYQLGYPGIIHPSRFDSLKNVHLPPRTLEEMYYYDIFKKHFADNDKYILPAMWSPPQHFFPENDLTDPSARALIIEKDMVSSSDIRKI